MTNALGLEKLKTSLRLSPQILFYATRAHLGIKPEDKDSIPAMLVS